MNQISASEVIRPLKLIEVDVIERGGHARPGRLACRIDDHVRFSPGHLQSYFFSSWQPLAYDLLLLAAAAEFCDRSKRRPRLGWGRQFDLSVPVHDPEVWQTPEVERTLRDALEFLTGDSWHITFRARMRPEQSSAQSALALPNGAQAVMPYSNGLDSRAVATLMTKSMGAGLVRVRLGSAVDEDARRSKEPFTATPYAVVTGMKNGESSGRSRGFKFAVIGAVAAHLANVHRIIMPESAQGALGPALVPVGHAYEDYRSHPAFTKRMSAFLHALIGKRLSFELPRLWHTKAETLREFAALDRNQSWKGTQSCWQQSRQSSVNGRRRQCGICAACMLRRMSLDAAGLGEDENTYVWEDLHAGTFKEGAALGFNGITTAMREYAIAGVLHLEHLAGLLNSPAHQPALQHNIGVTAEALGLTASDCASRIEKVLGQHSKEWREFLTGLGKESFIARWAGRQG